MKCPVTVGGLVTVPQRRATAGGTIFLLLEDEHGHVNVIVPRPTVDVNEEVVKRDASGARIPVNWAGGLVILA